MKLNKNPRTPSRAAPTSKIMSYLFLGRERT